MFFLIIYFNLRCLFTHIKTFCKISNKILVLDLTFFVHTMWTLFLWNKQNVLNVNNKHFIATLFNLPSITTGSLKFTRRLLNNCQVIEAFRFILLHNFNFYLYLIFIQFNALSGPSPNFAIFFIFHPIFLTFAHNMWKRIKKQFLL